MNKAKIKGIIFDCDGTLVDSETLSADLISMLLKSQDVLVSSSSILKSFRGVRFDDFLYNLSKQYPGLRTDLLRNDFRTQCIPLFEERLQPISGAIEFVKSLELPVSLASNGPRQKIETSLKAVGMLDIFEKSIVSAYEVKSWKPDPKIILAAVENLNLSPSDCLVIEDSAAGIEAGISAGCRVVGMGEEDFSRYTYYHNFSICKNFKEIQRFILETNRT